MSLYATKREDVGWLRRELDAACEEVRQLQKIGFLSPAVRIIAEPEKGEEE